MSFILGIDTTRKNSVVFLSNGTGYYRDRVHEGPKDHGRKLHTGITDLLHEAHLRPEELAAVSVAAGPGSYTGIRVGFSAAKGMAYALGRPLISVSTLKLMAAEFLNQNESTSATMFCPMIDARRDEVFTAVYDRELQEITPAVSAKVSPSFLASIVSGKSCVFFGDGAAKLRNMMSEGALINPAEFVARESFAKLSHIEFVKREFAAIATEAPLYAKEFQFI